MGRSYRDDIKKQNLRGRRGKFSRKETSKIAMGRGQAARAFRYRKGGWVKKKKNAERTKGGRGRKKKGIVGGEKFPQWAKKGVRTKKIVKKQG